MVQKKKYIYLELVYNKCLQADNSFVLTLLRVFGHGSTFIPAASSTYFIISQKRDSYFQHLLHGLCWGKVTFQTLFALPSSLFHFCSCSYACSAHCPLASIGIMKRLPDLSLTKTCKNVCCCYNPILMIFFFIGRPVFRISEMSKQ